MARTKQTASIQKAQVFPAPHLALSHATWKKLGAAICPNNNITKCLVLELNSFVNDMFLGLAKQAREMQSLKKATMSALNMQNAIKLIMPCELAKHAISEGTMCLCRVGTGDKKGGIVFPITKVHTALKKLNISKRIGKSTSIFLAAALEYLSAEIIELTAKEQRTSMFRKLKGLKTSLLYKAFHGDEELAKLGERVDFTSSGFRLSGSTTLQEKQRNVVDTSADPTTFKRPFGKAVFTRVVRELVEGMSHTVFGVPRFRAAALEKLQVAAEAHLIKFLQEVGGQSQALTTGVKMKSAKKSFTLKSRLWRNMGSGKGCR